MKTSYHIGTIWGIPLKIHISLFLLLGYLSIHAFAAGLDRYGFGGAIVMVVGVVLLQTCIFASIGLHELGHCFVAIRKGCRVREITLLIMGGAAVMENIPRRPKDEFAMAIAGPAVSASLALLLGFLAVQFPLEPQPRNLTAGLGSLFFLTAIANGLLAVFNLLPAYPMDGGRIMRALLTPFWGRLRATRFAMAAGRVQAILIALVAILLIPTELPILRFSLLLIAGFVFVTGKREYRQVQMEILMQQRGFAPAFGSPPNDDWDAPPPDDQTVLISPPPYQRGPADQAHIEKVSKRRFPF